VANNTTPEYTFFFKAFTLFPQFLCWQQQQLGEVDDAVATLPLLLLHNLHEERCSEM